MALFLPSKHVGNFWLRVSTAKFPTQDFDAFRKEGVFLI